MPEISKLKIFSSFLKQTEFLIEHFEEYVINYQCRTGIAKEKIFEVTFCLACNGSFFSDSESIKADRIASLRMLLQEMQRRKMKAKIYLETCVDDYLKFVHSEKSEETLHILRELNTTILVGFESYDEFTREKIYVKDLKMENFEEVYAFNNRNGIETGTFLYTGYHSMTDNEIIIDFVKTMCYISSKDILPVLMFSNVQKYTIPHFLFVNDKYSLMDPYTAWNLFKILVWFTPKRQNKNYDPWLTGDVYGGPPIPDINVFTNAKKMCCQKCSHRIQEALQYIRRSLDISVIGQVDEDLHNCSNGCYDKYLAFLKETDLRRQKKALDVRVAENIIYSQSGYKKYLFDEDMGLLKKMLLCYGLNVTDETHRKLREYNAILGQDKNIHIAQIQLPNGEYVNADTQEKYCKKSPFSLQVVQGIVGLYRLDKKICDVKIQPAPNWISETLSDGTPLVNILVPHGNHVLSLARHRACYFKQIQKGCKYCTSISYTNNITKEKLLSNLKMALEYVKSSGEIYSLALSGGTTCTPDRGIIDFISTIKAARDVIPDIKISVEVVPPSSMDYLDLLFDEKINSIIMNLEFYDQKIRQKMCPGKSDIPLKLYFQALHYSVQKLGNGNVSSVMIAGIEDISSTIKGARQLIDIGVLPTIMPFRPYDESMMADHSVTDVDCLIDIERDLEQYALARKLNYSRGAGCIGCNACIGVNIVGRNNH